MTQSETAPDPRAMDDDELQGEPEPPAPSDPSQARRRSSRTTTPRDGPAIRTARNKMCRLVRTTRAAGFNASTQASTSLTSPAARTDLAQPRAARKSRNQSPLLLIVRC